MDYLIALAGNPNSGKTTIFNALTGARQRVGNYPGVTVERREGFLKLDDLKVKIVDLPGTYSLTSYSPEEVIARQVIVEEKPQVVVDIVDASNLERNLYLTTQLIEMGVPLVIVLNMMDDAEDKGLKIDVEKLSQKLGVPVIPTIGHKRIGLDQLKGVLADVLKGKIRPIPNGVLFYPREIQDQIKRLEKFLTQRAKDLSNYPPRWLAIKALEGDPEVLNFLKERAGLNGELSAILEAARKEISEKLGEDPEAAIAEARYLSIKEILKDPVHYEPKKTLTDRIDAIVCHKILGLPIFLAVMTLLFQAVFAWATPFMDMIDASFGWLGETVGTILPDGMLKSLLVDGIIAGVGGVLVFLPQIMILFFLLSLLEDIGYMPRAAFVVDRLLKPFGLNGKSFVPLLSCFACNIPGIMGTRVIESYRQRMLTILAAPFMSCSARLPIYILLIAAFIPDKPVLGGLLNMQGLVLLAMYLLGIAAAVFTVVVFRSFLFKGEPTPFLMEMPPYRIPTLRNVLLQMWSRAVLYLRKAGTVILAISIIMWVLFNFPQNPPLSKDYEALKAQATNEEQLLEIENQEASERLAKSYAGRFGHFIEPLIKPLGFDWRIGIALTSAFAAKEVLVATLGQIYALGEVGEDSPSLIESIRKDPIFNPITAVGLMIFSLLMVPCMATLPVIKMETGSWRWPAIVVGWTLLTAWGATFLWVRLIGPALL